MLFFIAAIGALAGAIGVVDAAQPVLQRARAGLPPDLPGGAVPAARAEFVAAAQVVVYAGAVMVLYVFVVAYVGGGDEAAGRPGARWVLGPLFALALAVELCIAMLGSALKGISGKGAPTSSASARPRRSASCS